MPSGLERFLAEDRDRYRGARIGLCCNPTAVDRKLDHAVDLLTAAGLPPSRLFGPEHGVKASAQDMIGVRGEDPGVPTVSLYGESAESLRPDPDTLSDLDVLLFDVQDVGSRYYTYQATLGYLMEVAGAVGTKVVVLDRPNPITGAWIEGNVVREGHESFVSAYPLAVRHGMTVGELARFFVEVVGIDCQLEVVEHAAGPRHRWFDETDLPWVLPSPNMPTLETTVIYPGLCLVEGTNLSEGRGTTRPFHLVGAPWLDPERFTELCRKGAIDAGLQGVGFRAASFLPQFQKHAGRLCGGVQVHVTDRETLESFLLGMVVIEAARRCDPERFAWRRETYEFVDDPIAIDLLVGNPDFRQGLELGVRPRELLDAWKPELDDFAEKRASVLLYA